MFPCTNAKANTIGSTIGVEHRQCQYLEPGFLLEIATVIRSIYPRFVSDITGVTID